MAEWLANWHADGCPVKKQISLPQSQGNAKDDTILSEVKFEKVKEEQEQDPYLIKRTVKLPTVSFKPLVKNRDQLIIALHQAGRSNEEIAEQVGVPVGTVSKVVVRSYLTTKREALERVAKRVQ